MIQRVLLFAAVLCVMSAGEMPAFGADADMEALMSQIAALEKKNEELKRAAESSQTALQEIAGGTKRANIEIKPMVARANRKSVAQTSFLTYVLPLTTPGMRAAYDVVQREVSQWTVVCNSSKKAAESPECKTTQWFQWIATGVVGDARKALK